MPRGGRRPGAGRPKGSHNSKRPEEMTLEQEYANDPILLRFYKRKLLIRGWAGHKTSAERDYCAHRPRGSSTSRSRPPTKQSASAVVTSSLA